MPDNYTLPFMPFLQAEMACEHCGNHFLFPKHQIGKRRFCTHACSTESLRTAVQRTCEHCGATFTAVPAEIKRRGARFCSRACSAIGGATTGPKRRPAADRFWEKVKKTDTCWLWTGATLVNGYGAFGRETSHRGGRMEPAHVASWKLAGGEIPPGLCILHACDQRACVRNDDVGAYEVNGAVLPRRGHLFLGTRDDNTHDMMAKGRMIIGRRHRGEGHYAAKLTEDLVRFVRTGIADGTLTRLQAARLCGVAPQVIDAAVTRKTWRHVD